MLMKAIVIAAGLMAAPACANVITFETAPVGFGFTGEVTENGFTYRNDFGSFTIDSFGNPGHDLEGTPIASGGGVVSIRRADGGTFTFDSIDFAASDSTASGTQDLVVGGLREDFIVFDVFTLSNTLPFPMFDNWTTEFAGNLAGMHLDSLIIILGAGNDPAFSSAIDNVVLTPDPVPEPATIALMAATVLLLRRRRRGLAAAP